MSKYWEAIAKLPRAAKWGLGGLLVVVLYFAVIERTIDAINAVSTKADASAVTLQKFAASSGPQEHALSALQLGVRQFGDVDFPSDQATRSVAFNKAVDKVLADQKVSGAKSRTKSAPLGQGPLNTKVGPDQRVDRMVRDIEFDATPEVVEAVIAGLEGSPVVAAISKVQIHQVEGKDKGGRMVHATVTAEAWFLTSKKG